MWFDAAPPATADMGLPNLGPPQLLSSVQLYARKQLAAERVQPKFDNDIIYENDIRKIRDIY